MNKETVCPNCGSKNMVLTTTTVAHFAINNDGSMGKPILDKEGVDCINGCASVEINNVKFKCRDCRSQFLPSTKIDASKWYIGREI